MEITNEKLRQMYESLTIEKMLEELKIKSRPTLYRLLDEAGIERKRTLSPRRKTFLRLVK